MREHQKVLPVRGEGGELTRHFLAVCDQIGDPSGLIARGNEWVVNARFADARFFWEDDAKVRLEDRLPRLGALQFQEKLGDTLKKTARIRELADRLAARISRPDLIDAVDRAATLLKTDLVTGMVGEFPDLQGVVGGLYARREGEPAGRQADHYQARWASAGLQTACCRWGKSAPSRRPEGPWPPGACCSADR